MALMLFLTYYQELGTILCELFFSFQVVCKSTFFYKVSKIVEKSETYNVLRLLLYIKGIRANNLCDLLRICMGIYT